MDQLSVGVHQDVMLTESAPSHRGSARVVSTSSGRPPSLTSTDDPFEALAGIPSTKEERPASHRPPGEADAGPARAASRAASRANAVHSRGAAAQIDVRMLINGRPGVKRKQRHVTVTPSK